MTELDTNPELMYVVKLRKKTHDPDGLLWVAYVEDASGEGICCAQYRTITEVLTTCAGLLEQP